MAVYFSSLLIAVARGWCCVIEDIQSLVNWTPVVAKSWVAQSGKVPRDSDI